MTDDELFGTAQLINSALLAKIHTIEWTPAIISHPVLKVAMRANWFGMAGEKVHRRLGRISSSDVISGIPGSHVDHHGAPYQLTEEFAAVYRLHPLLPDTLEVRALADDALVDSMDFEEIILLNAHRVLTGGAKVADLWYSFGTQHPGAVVLHNFPRWMQDLTLPDGTRLDLAALDIMRDRERGVPRYNQFRRRLHLKPAETFAELTDNPVWAAELAGDVRRRRREGRSADRDARRDAAQGLRLQRHGVPRVHPDGQPAPEERPLPHRLLHRGVLHAHGAATGWPTTP